MGLLKGKYESLAPRSQYLCDIVVLAQAWKKSHSYIRRHNWYADTLELDCSAVDLDRKLSEWAYKLSRDKYQPDPMRLVPAPKNAQWIFNEELPGGWGMKPNPSGKLPALRPLAHLGIREQTVATAIMLCLANCIETAQGNPAETAEEAAARSVYSYGNRLYCNWSHDRGQAQFSWGNANTYSRFYQDYQQFVERPNAIARRVCLQRSDEERVFIVKLDLSAFYDNIDVSRLIACLKREYTAFRKADLSKPPADAKFWRLAQQALQFRWQEKDEALSNLFQSQVLPNGLPQGMVASGFFANAYLLDFDRAVGFAASKATVIDVQHGIRVHDYCRYVDDLRLVVSVGSTVSSEVDVTETMARWVQARLAESTAPAKGKESRLRVNNEKTEIELYNAVGGESGTAARMKIVQQQLSGPFDMATLHQVEAGLNGLLALAELGLMEDSSGPTGGLPSLASVARPKLEVRDDTLTRFSAYRLTKSLRMRRSLTDLSEKIDDVSAKEALAHDFEVAARRLVAAWAVNPSLVQVLRYALDLFPSPKLLETVTDALTRKLMAEPPAPVVEQRVVFYVLAELFRAAATETGRRAVNDSIFEVGDIVEYRDSIAVLAQTMLEMDGVPWYVQQQAAMLLATVGQSTADLPDLVELRFHRSLHEFLRAESKSRQISTIDEVAISLVGDQLHGQPSDYVKWFRRFAFGRKGDDVRDALQLIGQVNQQLFIGITQRGGGLAEADAQLVPRYLSEYVGARWPADPPMLSANSWISLAKVITHPAAVFDQENALLQLALALTSLPQKVLKTPESLTPLNIEISCTNWAQLPNPNTSVLTVRYVAGQWKRDPVYATPTWCTAAHAWMYALGRLLRAAATGELDFTTRQWLLRDETGWYRGIRSTWQKRRVGMLHTATALRGTTSAVTPWFMNLLLNLLRWPGIATDEASTELGSIRMPNDFAQFVRARLAHQAALFGVSSNVPVYRYSVDWPLRPSRQLRMVLVQGLMPAFKDFSDGLVGLDTPGYRERHRNHTAALLHLAYRQLQARDSVLGKEHKPQVDLIIFPEYAIHVNDQDLMRAFSDATGAMLFYGLLGATVPGTSHPANMARWLVPQRRGGRRSWVEVDQGKWHLTEEEKKLHVRPWRPYQVVIELNWNDEPGYRISGAVCYDATDIALAADLKDESHMFIVAAMNQDVKTFDSMVSALRYHMYQHVLIANAGEFGGSTAQAPYDREHERLVSHVHGSNQIAVSVFDVDVDHFGPKLEAAKPAVAMLKTAKVRIGKTPPAGLKR